MYLGEPPACLPATLHKSSHTPLSWNVAQRPVRPQHGLLTMPIDLFDYRSRDKAGIMGGCPSGTVTLQRIRTRPTIRS
jgi:hypothetical protein